MRSEDFHDLIPEQAARQQVLLTAGGDGAARAQTFSSGPQATNNTSGMTGDKSKNVESASKDSDTKDTVDVLPSVRTVEDADGKPLLPPRHPLLTTTTAPSDCATEIVPGIRVESPSAPLCLTAVLIGLCASNVANAQSHADQLNVYARALSTTTFAEQACPGFRTNAAKLAQMRAQARITDAEDATIAGRIRESTASITSTYERVGQGAWCADTYRLFGPDGTLVKGALTKKP